MAGLPTGTVTFLFTDIEGSTRMWESDAKRMQVALARHDEILRSTTEEHGGHVFKTVGDAFCCAFPTAPNALEAALEAQRTLLSQEWGETGPLRVRMALHTGAAEERGDDYFGPPLNRVARLLSAAHGGQVLLSAASQEMVRDQLPAGSVLMDLGERRLKDLFRPERVFQLTANGLPSAFPPLRTLESHPNNLPLQPTPLVGREREVEEISERLRSEEVRLLTLTGPGGTGKTRLALQAAADLLEEFEDGVFFITLAAITDPELVPSTIAGALGVMESAEQPLLETLKSFLQQKHLLLLLDNFEQVLEGAPVVGELVAADPKLKILATSRIPLRLYGEQEYMVPPLALPDPRVLPPVKVLTQYEAVRLFVERARAVKADFEVTNESAPAVAEICARLDGLPLAIELAAARIRILPPQKMLERLSNRLKLLKGGPRDLPTRQQTLRGTIDWSYELLEEDEKTLFGRLSVFSGGRTLEAIEEICDPEGDLEALDGVESLLEKSLLRQEVGPGGEPRFVMLETVHEYAREKLGESGEAEVMRGAHAEYFLALAKDAEPALKGPEQLEWLERLEAEHDNLRAALGWALESKDGELALRLAGALWWFWFVHGHLRESRAWLEAALAEGAALSSAPKVRAKAITGAGRLALEVGELEWARALLEEGVQLFRKAGDEAGLAEALDNLGIAAAFSGELEKAKPLFEESLALYRGAANGWGVGEVLNNLAQVARIQDKDDTSLALYEESLATRRKVGDKRGIAMSLLNMGAVWVTRSEYERAAKLTEDSLVLYRELGDKATVVENLANLGELELERGNLKQAERHLREGLILSKIAGHRMPMLYSLLGFGRLAEKRGELLRSARLFGFMIEAPEATFFHHLMNSSEKARLESSIATVRSRLGEVAWEEAYGEGRSMTLDEAVSYALEEDAEGRT
jgi:predicted ATPase/class 3 adenylate cyclase